MKLFCDLKCKSQKWFHQKGLDFKHKALGSRCYCLKLRWLYYAIYFGDNALSLSYDLTGGAGGGGGEGGGEGW